MLKPFTAFALVGLSAGAAIAADPSQITGYGLTQDGSTLMMFTDLNAPDGAEMLSLMGGDVDAIAYRPVTGELIGFSKEGKIYAIDTTTGALTDLNARSNADVVMDEEAAVALDFNNAIDAMRAVSTGGANVVYFPTDFGDEKANAVKRFTDLAYAEGDENEGATPHIFANAYTNAIDGEKQAETFQYVLDSDLDILASLANNQGTLSTVAPLMIEGEPLDISAAGGFDIVSVEAGDNTAVALLTLEGEETAGLYTIDLKNGAVEMLGDTAVSGFTGFAAMAE